jgi:hypothetical protein
MKRRRIIMKRRRISSLLMGWGLVNGGGRDSGALPFLLFRWLTT